MQDDQNNQDRNDLSPSEDTAKTPNQEGEPTSGRYKVPQDLVDAGQPVADVETDSPETLDEALKEGDERGDIDPTERNIP